MRRFAGFARWTCPFAILCFASLGTERLAAQPSEPVDMPAAGTVLRISLGLKDREPTDWDGRIEVSQGEVVDVVVQPVRAGKAERNSWKAKSQPPKKLPQKSVHDPKQAKLERPVVLATLDASQAAKVSVVTNQGTFSFALGDLKQGTPQTLLDGQARVELLPLTVRLTSRPGDEDLPAAAQDADGNVWVAYMAYTHAGPLDIEAIHNERKFDTLLSEGHGDQVRLLKFDGNQWSQPLEVTLEQLDVWRPAVAVDGQGAVWVVWSQKVDDNWDLYARSFDADRLSKSTIRLTTAPGADINAVAVTDPTDGKVYVAWQGWRDGSFDILLTSLDGHGAAPEKKLSAAAANQWCPAAAFDSTGKLHVAFDTYETGNYDVKLVSDAASKTPRTIDVAASPRYEARPSIAVDSGDRVWIAYEEAGVQWGKDSGMKWVGRTGQQLYFQREIVLRAVEGGRVRHAPGPVPTDPVKRNYPIAETRRLSLPRLSIDAKGRLWLLVRRHPNNSGGGEIWASFITHHTGTGWAPLVPLAHSTNVMDNRPAMVPVTGGGILVVHSSDDRTGGTQKAKQNNRENNLYGTLARTGDEVKSPVLGPVPEVQDVVVPVHPNEVADIRRIRDYRASIGGKTYRLLRGEFHRHTELTSHRDQDGTLEEMWRYAVDVAGMDWIGNGDHDNGYGMEYLWWLVQKQTDFYHHPPRFMPMFTYERSVVYPSGHRNAMFAYRGVRPLPRVPGGKGPLYGTPEEGSPDIKTFYAYLRHFGGICASHTSGTNMGTDWRDNDPEVEPIVEIYQGLRQSYEYEGAPATAKDAKDSIGGYRPLGFIWNALMKGYRLGFEVSSDHYSTHISYAVVYAEEPTREAILDAFKKRHSYGANDNIILDVRCGDKMMGDAFVLDERPRLDIRVIGTEPIARVSIIRGTGSDTPQYVFDTSPNEKEVKITWTDTDPAWDSTSYYYVRVEQVPPANGYGALAWASPMWIELKR